MDQIPVQVQTPAVASNDFKAVRFVIASDGKRGAGFQNRENTDEAFGYSIPFGDGTRLGFLRLAAGMRRGGFGPMRVRLRAIVPIKCMYLST